MTGDGKLATDPDGDGIYDDVNGDVQVAPGDTTALFRAVFANDDAVMNNPDLFDINGDGQVTSGDASVLFEESL